MARYELSSLLSMALKANGSQSRSQRNQSPRITLTVKRGQNPMTEEQKKREVEQKTPFKKADVQKGGPPNAKTDEYLDEWNKKQGR